MTKISSLLSISLLSILLCGCTLTPARFTGEDLLDTEHKTEMQDPVAVPVKEFSDKPLIKAVVVPVAPKAAAAEPKKITAPEIEKPKAEIIPAPVIAPVVPPVSKPVIEAPKKEEGCNKDKKAEILPPPAPGAVKKAEQTHSVLKKGDRVKIVVFREKDLSGDYTLNDKGEITLPLLGKVQAAALTAVQLQEKLKTDLSKGYLVKPDVTVEILPDCNPV